MDPLPFPRRQGLALHQELHARPALPTRSPCVVSYWVHVGMSETCAQAALRALCQSVGTEPPAADQRHARVAGPHWVLKYERHGEFVSWQVNRPMAPTPWPDDDTQAREALTRASALSELPAAFREALRADDAGALLAATHVVVIDAQGSDELIGRCRSALRSGSASTHEDLAPLMGAFIGDARAAALFTALQLGPDGFVRFVLLDFGLPPDQLAREAQRLCEIEAYRMLAMQGFPLAQAESATLGTLEQRLQATMDAMVNDDQRDDSEAFRTLTTLAAEVEHAAARTRYRFSATRAYHAIVQQRLSDLREQRMQGIQTLSGFLARRFAPAMAFCESTDRRLTDLGERISRALSLARVRLEAQREQGNQELLRALAERQHQQLRLQQTVEGLSVVAISYYALGLVGYVAKALGHWPLLAAWLPSNETLVGLAVLPVVLGVAWGLRRLRH